MKRCYRGGYGSGNLWTVWEVTLEGQAESEPPLYRYIELFMLQYYRGKAEELVGWGYKPIPEKDHPYFYSCPLSYLDMVPEDRYPEQTRPDWRRTVRDIAGDKKRIREANAAIRQKQA